MSTDTKLAAVNAESYGKTIEMENLVPINNDLEQGNRASGKAIPLKAGGTRTEGLLQRLGCQLTESRNMKVLMRTWEPRIEFILRLMLVATFLEDSFGTITNFSAHAKQVGEEAYLLNWLSETSPGFVCVTSIVALGFGLLAQLIGSICLIMLIKPDVATKVLIGWAIAQPFLYAQLSNLEFIAESLSIIGGLLMLRAHLVSDRARNLVQFLGRVLLPMMYLYYLGHFMYSMFTLEKTSSLGMFISSLSMFVINVLLLVALAICSMLVAAGLKSRVVALLLALVNLIFVFQQHPFFRMIKYQGGEWKYIEDNMSMPHVVLPTDVTPNEIDPEQIYALHKYYFFLGLSTSGALLLLAQYGPGHIAVQKDEAIFPIIRAQD